MTRTAAALVLALSASQLVACAADDDDGGALRCAEGVCSDSCADLAGGECDLLQPDCRERVLRAVSCVRAAPGRLPEVRTLSTDEYEAELREEAEMRAAEMQDGGANDADQDGGREPGDRVADAGAPAATEEADPWSVAFTLLGLLPSGMSLRDSFLENRREIVAGYYDGETRRITLIDRGQPENDWGAIAVFAHELVHALQDQTLGLSALHDRSPSSTDGSFAHGCLIEGEAELYSDLALALLRGLPFDQAYADAQLAARLKYARRWVANAAAPYTALWTLRYAIGGRYLFDAYRADGHWAVQSLFEAPPTASIHWMIGYARNTERREYLFAPLACELAAAPPGYELYDRTSLGAITLYAFLANALRGSNGVLASEEQWRNALRWRQDDVSVFENAAGQVAVSYRVRFDSPDLAAALANGLTHNPRVSLRAVVHGAELELLAAEDDSLAEWHTDPNACPL